MTFEIPAGARRERRDEVLEWPRGSGRSAVYTPAEQELMLLLADEALALPKGDPRREEINREGAFLHDLKVEFGADLTTDLRDAPAAHGVPAQMPAQHAARGGRTGRAASAAPEAYEQGYRTDGYAAGQYKEVFKLREGDDHRKMMGLALAAEKYVSIVLRRRWLNEGNPGTPDHGDVEGVNVRWTGHDGGGLAPLPSDPADQPLVLVTGWTVEELQDPGLALPERGAPGRVVAERVAAPELVRPAVGAAPDRGARGLTQAIILGEARALGSREPLDGRVGRRLERLAGLGEGELSYVFALGNLLPGHPGRKPRRPGPHNSPGDRFDLAQARDNWYTLMAEVLVNREFDVVLLLGRNVARAARADYLGFLEWDWWGFFHVAVFPHPSGTSHYWNDPANVERASEFLRGVVARIDEGAASRPPPRDSVFD